MSNTTVTLQAVVNLASTHADLLPLAGVGGYSLEPALSLCNDVLQEIMANPQAWKFNSFDLPFFVTTIYRQDYQFGGAVGFSLNGGGAGIALKTASTPGVVRTGTTVVVTFLETHNVAVGDTFFMFGNVDAEFNSVFTQGPTVSGYSGGWTITAIGARTVTFTHATSGNTTSGAAGVTNFSWLENGTMLEVNTTAPIPRTWALEAVNNIQPTSMSAQPQKVCVLKDNGDGTLKIRFQYVPGNTIFAVNLVYQGLPPLKTALSDTWVPFPDQYGFVYRQGFLWRAYRYVDRYDSPRVESEYRKLQIAIQKAVGNDGAEASDTHLYPDQSLMSMGGGGYDEF